jgi:hypothetical protein
VTATGALVCPFHPDREGVGICVSCRRIVCADCATKLDGINHCKGCLEAKIGEATRKPSTSWRALERGAAALVIGVAVVVLTGIFFAIGLNAADISWFGSGPGDTARALEEAVEGLRSFQRDVGRYPSDQEGLRALFTDTPNPNAPPIDKWKGPYAKMRFSPEGVEIEQLRDGYNHPLRYIGPSGRGRPAALSIGPDGSLDTEVARLRRGDPARGDDSIQWVQ